MKRTLALVLIAVFCLDSALYAGIGSDKSMYVGGTTASIPKDIQGPISTDDSKLLQFKWNKTKDKDTPTQWAVPYDKITSIAYGQHAGRRVGATVAWGVTTMGLMALPILFSKKRKHYLTLEYTDDKGDSQAAVFEVGKGAIRSLLASLEVRTGKKVAYEDDEARKAGNK
jgi:hypothetical protein